MRVVRKSVLIPTIDCVDAAEGGSGHLLAEIRIVSELRQPGRDCLRIADRHDEPFEAVVERSVAPVFSVAITGQPQASVSPRTIPKPSSIDGNTNTFALSIGREMRIGNVAEELDAPDMKRPSKPSISGVRLPTIHNSLLGC